MMILSDRLVGESRLADGPRRVRATCRREKSPADLPVLRRRLRAAAAPIGWPASSGGLVARSATERSLSGYCGPSRNRADLGLRVGRIEEPVPDVALAGLRQRESNRLPVAVEQHQQRLADDRLAALVLVVDQVAGQADAQALDEPGVPVLVRHLLARGAEEEMSLTFEPRMARPRKNFRR